jgi:putative flippase GtrA
VAAIFRPRVFLLLDDDPPRHRRTGLAPLLRIALQRPRGSGISHWVHSFSLHVVTGFAAVAAHYALMYGLLRAGVAPVPASAIGFGAGALTRFALSYSHIFSPSAGVHRAGLRFAVVVAAQLVANSALLAALTRAGIDVWPAQVTTTVLLTFGNYLVYRWWVFR